MVQVIHTIMLFSSAAAGSLVNAIIGGVALVAAVALVMRIVPGMTAAARFVVWTAALLLVVALHFLPALRGGSNIGAAAHGDLLHLDARWALAIAGVWAMLSLVRATQLVLGALRLRRIARRAVPVRVEFAGALMKSGRTAEICVSDEVDRPSVAGFFSPRILLPPGVMEKLSQRELKQIVLHEMEHLRRRDDWMNLLQKVGLVLFPLNPAMSWVERRMCMERELACDDCVLRATRARKDYATCLTNLAEHSLVRRGTSLALGAWERQSELAQRVHRILRRPEAMLGRTQARFATGALIAGMMGGAVALVGSPELVSFAPASHAQAESAAEAGSFGMNAGFAGMRGAKPTLVKAVMPERRPVVAQKSLAAMPKPHRKSALDGKGAQEKSVVKHRAAQKQAGVILTDWQAGAPQSRATLTRSLYAAVPMGDGWLVIQL